MSNGSAEVTLISPSTGGCSFSVPCSRIAPPSSIGKIAVPTEIASPSAEDRPRFGPERAPHRVEAAGDVAQRDRRRRGKPTDEPAAGLVVSGEQEVERQHDDRRIQQSHRDVEDQRTPHATGSSVRSRSVGFVGRTGGCPGPSATAPTAATSEHGDLAHRVDAAEVDEDHVDDVLALAVGLRPLDHLRPRSTPRRRRSRALRRRDREHEDRRADEQRHREPERAHDRRSEIDEPRRQEPQHEHEQHRAERLDRELGERQIGRTLRLVECRHREADRAEHHDRGDPPPDQRSADRRRDDDRHDRQLDRVLDPLREFAELARASESPGRPRPW